MRGNQDKYKWILSLRVIIKEFLVLKAGRDIKLAFFRRRLLEFSRVL